MSLQPDPMYLVRLERKPQISFEVHLATKDLDEMANGLNGYCVPNQPGVTRLEGITPTKYSSTGVYKPVTP